jgi:hypothetical protein
MYTFKVRKRGQYNTPTWALLAAAGTWMCIKVLPQASSGRPPRCAPMPVRWKAGRGGPVCLPRTSYPCKTPAGRCTHLSKGFDEREMEGGKRQSGVMPTSGVVECIANSRRLTCSVSLTTRAGRHAAGDTVSARCQPAAHERRDARSAADRAVPSDEPVREPGRVC